MGVWLVGARSGRYILIVECLKYVAGQVHQTARTTLTALFPQLYCPRLVHSDVALESVAAVRVEVFQKHAQGLPNALKPQV